MKRQNTRAPIVPFAALAPASCAQDRRNYSVVFVLAVLANLAAIPLVATLGAVGIGIFVILWSLTGALMLSYFMSAVCTYLEAGPGALLLISLVLLIPLPSWIVVYVLVDRRMVRRQRELDALATVGVPVRC